MTISKCGHDTNDKTGVCVICSKFKAVNCDSADVRLNPASRSLKTAKKQNRGSKGGNAGSAALNNPNKKLKRYARAQISCLLSLAYQGNLPVLIKRLHLLQRYVRDGEKFVMLTTGGV